MLAGFGFAEIVRWLPRSQAWIGTAAVLTFVAILGLRAADSANMTRIVQSEGEWAIDYRSREAIAMDLALRLGVTPAVYAKRTFWWWVGWSIDPETYQVAFGLNVALQIAALVWLEAAPAPCSQSSIRIRTGSFVLRPQDGT